MKLIINIPDTDIPKRQDILSIDLCFVGGQVGQCTYPFEVLKQEPIEVLQEIREEIKDIRVFNNVYNKNGAIVAMSYRDGISVKEEVIAIINSHLDKELSE